MKIKSIKFLTEIADIEDDSVDVVVETKDGNQQVIEFVTYKYLMRTKDEPASPGWYNILVERLTEEVISNTIEAYLEDNAYWLKLYQFANAIDPKILDKLQENHMKEIKETD